MAAEASQERRPQRFPDKSAAELSLLRNGSWSSPRQNAEAPARAEELGRVAEIYPKLALWARLRRGGSASGPMPIAQSRPPRDACLVSACSMLPSRREVPPNLPPGPFTYKEAAQILGVHFEPARKEDLLSGEGLCFTSCRPRCWTRRETESFWRRTRRSYCTRRKFPARLARGTLRGTANPAREWRDLGTRPFPSADLRQRSA